jgi:23S rRNA (adenine2503-C2)-methyltransferase
MQIQSVRDRLRALGAQPKHVSRIIRLWANALPQDHGKRDIETFLPARVREALPGLQAELEGLATLHEEHPGDDGSARLLVRLGDGQLAESVLMPPGRIPGLCVSTQIGCAVGCTFCMTGQSGLIRQLTSGEIVAQVALARRLRPVQKVVFMGMGEPAHNLDAVMEAIDLLGTVGNIGHKNLVFSTVGDERAFERLGQGPVKPALAVSLHTTRPELRTQLLPRAPRLSPEQLMDHAEAYARLTKYPVQVQWTLLEGVNDSDEELDGIERLLKGKYAVLNFIPYNPSEGMPYRRPSWERAAEMARHLHRKGILTKLRHSAGQDVDGGCGQLRARATTAPQPVRVLRHRVGEAG